MSYEEQHSHEIDIVLSGNEEGTHWEHTARQSSYHVVGAVTIQSEIPVPDGTILVLYQSNKDGFYYGRPRPEFQDGRFRQLDVHPEYRDKDARIFEALETANIFGGIEGSHHKTWIIDQMVRYLTGNDYEKWVKKYCEGDDGSDTYEWNTGIAP